MLEQSVWENNQGSTYDKLVEIEPGFLCSLCSDRRQRVRSVCSRHRYVGCLKNRICYLLWSCWLGLLGQQLWPKLCNDLGCTRNARAVDVAHLAEQVNPCQKVFWRDRWYWMNPLVFPCLKLLRHFFLFAFILVDLLFRSHWKMQLPSRCFDPKPFRNRPVNFPSAHESE